MLQTLEIILQLLIQELVMFRLKKACNAENVIEKGGNSKAVDLCRSQAVSDRIVDSDPVSGNDSAVLHDKREGHSQEHETSTMQQNGKRKMSQTHPSIIKRNLLKIQSRK